MYPINRSSKCGSPKRPSRPYPRRTIEQDDDSGSPCQCPGIDNQRGRQNGTRHDNSVACTGDIPRCFRLHHPSSRCDRSARCFKPSLTNRCLCLQGPWETRGPDWRDKAEEIIDLIRTNEPKRTVLVGGVNWGYDLSGALTQPVRRQNVVYVTHPYPGKKREKSFRAAFEARSG